MTTSISDGMGSLVAGLSAAGALPAAYRYAFQAVDRAQFIPDRIWVGDDDDRGDIAVDREIDPKAWEEAVYDATLPIVTQFDDGTVMWPEQGHRPTSSASAPTVVAGMLRVLGVQPGDNVVEIGTGSGYNAALLSVIVGPDGQVSTVEVDPDVAAEATARLEVDGYLHNVRVIVGDGATTTPTDRPWDRVIATAAVPLGRLPYGWVEHTQPGGIIVVPMFADLTSDPLVRLVVADEGTARGHADAELNVGFMHLRTERPARAALGALVWDDESADLLHTSVDIWDPLHDQAWCWAMAVAMPSCRYNTYQPGERSERRLILFKDPVSGSWASIHGPDDEGRLAVRQSGPRHLGDEALAAIRWFARHGAPPLEAWLWEVGPDRQSVTLPGT
ncbi:MAG: methyltransferase domain-containing protein [Pseudonocardiaceae bacterium]